MKDHGACAGCGASIVWAMTERGKAMPLDMIPALTGTWIIEMKSDGAHVRSQTPEELAQRDDPKLPEAARMRFVSHFATCPKSAEFRK